LHTLVARAQTLARTLAAAAALALLILAAGAAAAARPVHAAAPNSTVTSLADADLVAGSNTCVSTLTGGDCTLRAAIELSDASGGGSTIRLNLPAPGQIKLTLGQLDIQRSLTVTGAGHAANAVTAVASPPNMGAPRVFAVEDGATVALSGLTVSGARNGFDGGGIFNGGNLTLTDVDVRDNTGGTAAVSSTAAR